MTSGLHSRLFRPGLVVATLLMLVSLSGTAVAAPFGAGSFGDDAPFGDTTSLAIALGGDVDLGLTLSGGTLSGTGSTGVTVTSNAAEGYGLYMYADGSSDMVSGSSLIPASTNGSNAPLSANTWGYNTTGSSTDFLGLSTLPTLIKQGTGPHTTGETTTVTFGVKADATQAAGDYSVSVVYTAVALN